MKKILIMVLTTIAFNCSTPMSASPQSLSNPLGRDLSSVQPEVDPVSGYSVVAEEIENTGTLTLPKALELALLNSPKLATAEWEIRAGEARTLQAKLLPNPEFSIQTENFGGNKTLKGFSGAETTFELSQLIELGGKRAKRMQQSAAELKLSGWDYETKRLDVLTEVTKDYIEMAKAQDVIALNEDVVRLAEQVLQTVAERVKAGKISPIEEIKAETELAGSQIELDKARRALESAKKKLASNWGDYQPKFIKVEGNLEAVRPIPTADELAQRIKQNPDLARWVMELEQRQATLGVEKSKKIPDITLSTGVKRLGENNENAFVTSLSIPIPLFNHNQGGIKEAEANLIKTESERNAVEEEIRATLAESYETLASAYQEIQALHSSVMPGAERAFNATREGFREGKFGYLEIVDAQRTLNEVKSRYIDALATYHKSIANLERLTGEPLFENAPAPAR